MKKILVATTNKGKFAEIKNEFKDLDFELLSLDDLNKKIKEPEEDQDSIEGNAYKKAKYYSKKSGMMSIADDTGLFVDALKGWPGVHCARIGNNDTDRRKKLLDKMIGIKNRKATFKTSMVVFNPKDNTSFNAMGETSGTILNKEVKKAKNGFGYDPIFKVNGTDKTYAEMTMLEKNLISHRGKALDKIKHFLIKHNSFKQYLVPIGIIVKDGKMLMNKRRDGRAEYNNKWEFPGGAIEVGESIEQSLLREVYEETGYKVKIKEKLPMILNEVVPKYEYQVFLLPFICSIKSGRLAPADNEVADSDWFTISSALKKPIMTLNKEVINHKDNLKILKKYIKY